MMLPIIIPAMILILGGLALPLLPKVLRSPVIVFLPLLTLWAIWSIPADINYTVHLAGFTLHPLYTHPFTMIFATVFSLAAFAGGVFSLNNKNITEISAAYVYAGSAVGATFAGDFITLFLYWEVMAVASTIVVLCGGTEKSRKAAFRYAAMHFFGGVVFLAGITAYMTATGNDLIGFNPTAIFTEELTLESLGIILILIGILVNAAAPPFSAWLSDAYPEASPTGAVFLSAFTTKTAIFVLLTLFAGTEILIYIGLFMVCYGILYAMLENDVRRILSYSIISQLGFMVTGVGIGTELAQWGVAAHAFCHIVYKALLFMSAGSVIFMTGRSRCTDLGGLYRSMKLTAICGIIGALSISAFPWTAGFVSKSLITSASAYEKIAFVWFTLAAASGVAFLYVGLKFPWFIFFQKDSGMRPEEPPINMRIAMVFLSAFCILLGVFPEYLYGLLPGRADYDPYTREHIVTQLQLLLFGGLAFFIFLPMMRPTNTFSIDMDWFYRVFIRNILLLTEKFITSLSVFGSHCFTRLFRVICDEIYKKHGPQGILARNWAIANTVLCATSLLGIFLILYYIGK